MQSADTAVTRRQRRLQELGRNVHASRHKSVLRGGGAVLCKQIAAGSSSVRPQVGGSEGWAWVNRVQDVCSVCPWEHRRRNRCTERREDTFVTEPPLKTEMCPQIEAQHGVHWGQEARYCCYFHRHTFFFFFFFLLLNVKALSRAGLLHVVCCLMHSLKQNLK